MLWYFFGEDSWAARQAVAAVAGERRARICWVDKSDLIDKSAAARLSQGRGLFDRDLLVMREVGSWLKEDQEDLLEALVKYPDSLCVIWERAKIDRRSRIYKTYAQQGREFRVPSNQQLKLWLMEEARGGGGEIEDGAAEVLVDRIGGDRWRLKSELERLKLMDKAVRIKDVKDSVEKDGEAEVFAMLEALTSGQMEKAIGQIKILLNEGRSEFYVFSMLAFQFRTLLLVRNGIDRGLGVDEIAGKSGMKSYPVQKSMASAKKKTVVGWREDLRKVLATDFLIKQGKADARTALMMLIVNLAGV